MNAEPIPFLDLVTPHRELHDELVAAFCGALDTAAFIGGAAVESFEAAFAEFCGTANCVGTNSGTDALRFALIAVGVRPGDVVVTVPNTFIATTEAISQAGATPEFVDVDERNYTMDPAKLQEYLERGCTTNGGHLISRRSGKPVTAVVPVHLYGQPANMDPILELAEQYQLKVVEDACQAHGAEYFSKRKGRWQRVGSIGHAAAFSFYPGKNLGACGDAGAVTTCNEAFACTCRMLRDHGQARKYYHEIEGYNGRLDAIQAAILRIKLAHLPRWNEQRRQTAAYYNQLLPGAAGIERPYEPAYAKSVYHLYVVKVPDREQVQQHLSSVGIATGIHYPVPLHLQQAYSRLDHQSQSFPITEHAARHILSIPMYPQISTEQQQRVVAALDAVASRSNAQAAVPCLE